MRGAILWDLDGTLVASEEYHWRAWRGAVARPFLGRSHAGVRMRMPRTFLVARR